MSEATVKPTNVSSSVNSSAASRVASRGSPGSAPASAGFDAILAQMIADAPDDTEPTIANDAIDGLDSEDPAELSNGGGANFPSGDLATIPSLPYLSPDVTVESLLQQMVAVQASQPLAQSANAITNTTDHSAVASEDVGGGLFGLGKPPGSQVTSPEISGPPAFLPAPTVADRTTPATDSTVMRNDQSYVMQGSTKSEPDTTPAIFTNNHAAKSAPLSASATRVIDPVGTAGTQPLIVRADEIYPSESAGNTRHQQADSPFVVTSSVTTSSAPDPTNFQPLSGVAPNNQSYSQSASITITTPMTQPGWVDDMAQSVRFIANSDSQKAEIVLTPPELGRIEVTIEMQGDQATAYFVSPSAEVRTALEDSLPRLREMLSNSGISLGQSSVGSESNTPRDRHAFDWTSDVDRPGARTPQGKSIASAVVTRTINGIVDTFA